MRGGQREFEGATLEETLRDAASQLGIAEEDIHYKVLETGRKGLFGFGVKNVRILVDCPEGTAPRPSRRRGRRPGRQADDARVSDAAASGAVGEVGDDERADGPADEDVADRGRGGRSRRRRRRGRGRRGGDASDSVAADSPAGAMDASADGSANGREQARETDDDNGDEGGRSSGRGERRRGGRGRGRRGRGRRGSGEERGGRREGSGEGRRRRERGERPSRRRPRPEPLGEPDERPEFMDDLEGTLQRMFGLMQIDLQVNGEYRKASGSRLILSGEDLESLRGEDGEFVRSVQFVLNRMARRSWPDSGRIQVVRDGEGEDDSRDEEIIAMAEEIARRVVDEGKAVRLDAMNPYERRLVHMTIRPMKGVTTRSEGDGFHKRIKVMPRRARRRRGERGGERGERGERGREREAERPRHDAPPAGDEHDELLTSTREEMPRSRPRPDETFDDSFEEGFEAERSEERGLDDGLEDGFDEGEGFDREDQQVSARAEDAVGDDTGGDIDDGDYDDSEPEAMGDRDPDDERPR